MLARTESDNSEWLLCRSCRMSGCAAKTVNMETQMQRQRGKPYPVSIDRNTEPTSWKAVMTGDRLPVKQLV
jgi:hypothetical protein